MRQKACVCVKKGDLPAHIKLVLDEILMVINRLLLRSKLHNAVVKYCINHYIILLYITSEAYDKVQCGAWCKWCRFL